MLHTHQHCPYHPSQWVTMRQVMPRSQRGVMAYELSNDRNGVKHTSTFHSIKHRLSNFFFSSLNIALPRVGKHYTLYNSLYHRFDLLNKCISLVPERKILYWTGRSTDCPIYHLHSWSTSSVILCPPPLHSVFHAENHIRPYVWRAQNTMNTPPLQLGVFALALSGFTTSH